MIIACTPSSLPTSFGSISLPLYRKTEVRAFILMFGSSDKLLISVSVIPSERYSACGSPVSLTNGITATDLISFDAPVLGRQKYPPSPMLPSKITPRAAITATRRYHRARDPVFLAVVLCRAPIEHV